MSLAKDLKTAQSNLNPPEKKPDAGVNPTGDFGGYVDRQSVMVGIELINPNPNQPRQYFDPEALEELSESVKRNGVLAPLIIRKEGDIIYLVAGERRLKAGLMAGLKEVPAIITTQDPAEIALIENLQREDLNPIEEAEGYQRLMESKNYTQNEVAERINKSRVTINEALILTNLPEEIKNKCRQTSTYSKRVLVEVARQDTYDKQISLFSQIESGDLKSTNIRDAVRKKKDGAQKSRAGAVLDKVLFLNKSLGKLDPAGIGEQDKIALEEGLSNLKKTIKKFELQKKVCDESAPEETIIE